MLKSSCELYLLQVVEVRHLDLELVFTSEQAYVESEILEAIYESARTSKAVYRTDSCSDAECGGEQS